LNRSRIGAWRPSAREDEGRAPSRAHAAPRSGDHDDDDDNFHTAFARTATAKETVYASVVVAAQMSESICLANAEDSVYFPRDIRIVE